MASKGGLGDNFTEIFQGLRDKIVDKLSQTRDEELQISTNITSNKQMDLFVEAEALTWLGSRYAKERENKMMRLACSWQGKERDDLVKIGMTPEVKKGGVDREDF